MMSLWVIEEAEEFIIINCCDYTYYDLDPVPPWDFLAEGVVHASHAIEEE